MAAEDAVEERIARVAGFFLEQEPFDPIEEDEVPLGGSKLCDQGALDGVFRPPAGLDDVQEALESLGIVAGQGRDAGVQAVDQRIEADSLFAL